MNYDQLHTLAQAIWMHVETYTLDDQTRRSFRYGNTDYVVTPDERGIVGAIGRLCVFFDEYVDSDDPPTLSQLIELDVTFIGRISPELKSDIEIDLRTED